MGECPSKECHNRVDGHHRTLYGPDGRSGVTADLIKKADKSCLKEYVKKPPVALVAVILTVILVPTVVTGVKVWSGQEMSPHIYAKKEQVSDHETRISVAEERYKQIQQDIVEIKTAIKDQKKDIGKQFEELKEFIKNN